MARLSLGAKRCAAQQLKGYGWWELGRAVSLSPLETAAAFGAPILFQTQNSTEAQDLLQHSGNKKVRYGDVKVTDNDGVERHALKIQELGVGLDPESPVRNGDNQP